MRAAYLSPDRADIGDAVKNLAKYMQSPRQVDAARLKRLARYLKGRPRVVQKFTRDRNTANDDVVKVVIMVDSDNAGDKVSRRSTVGQVAFVGKHVVKHMCNILQVIGLSSGENEYYAISAGACTGLGIKGILEHWNVVCELKVVSDSSAARGFSSRRGVGKQKHIQTRYLWVQERLAMRHLDLATYEEGDGGAHERSQPGVSGRASAVLSAPTLTGPQRSREAKRPASSTSSTLSPWLRVAPRRVRNRAWKRGAPHQA
eukprot:3201655-Pyramimonas_sp.AAC.1